MKIITQDIHYGWVNHKLNESIIMYNGKAVVAYSIDKAKELTARKLGSAYEFTAPVADFDLTPLTLGYVNTTEGALLMQRKPSRSWRIGLSRTNCSIYPPRMSFEDIIECENFQKMLENIYPSFEEALTSKYTTAFHLDWAVTNSHRGNDTVVLLYRNRSVGYVVEGIPALGVRYQFLQEHLDCSLGNRRIAA